MTFYHVRRLKKSQGSPIFSKNKAWWHTFHMSLAPRWIFHRLHMPCWFMKKTSSKNNGIKVICGSKHVVLEFWLPANIWFLSPPYLSASKPDQNGLKCWPIFGGWFWDPHHPKSRLVSALKTNELTQVVMYTGGWILYVGTVVKQCFKPVVYQTLVLCDCDVNVWIWVVIKVVLAALSCRFWESGRNCQALAGGETPLLLRGRYEENVKKNGTGRQFSVFVLWLHQMMFWHLRMTSLLRSLGTGRIKNVSIFMKELAIATSPSFFWEKAKAPDWF